MSKNNKQASSVNRLNSVEPTVQSISGAINAATSEASPNELAKRDSAGRMKAAAGTDPNHVVVNSQLGGQVEWRGTLNAGGTIEYLPTDWTVSGIGTGGITINHNLGRSDYDVIVSMSQDVSYNVNSHNKLDNSFDIQVYDETGGVASGFFTFSLKLRPTGA